MQHARAKCGKHCSLEKLPVTKFAATSSDADLPRSWSTATHRASLEVLLRSACARRETPDKAAERWSCVPSEGLARGKLTRLPRPVSSWRATTLAWTERSIRVASHVSHHLPSLGRLPRAGGQVAVVFLLATLRWPQVRCTAGLVFLWGAVPGEDRHLVSSGGLFVRRHMLDT